MTSFQQILNDTPSKRAVIFVHGFDFTNTQSTYIRGMTQVQFDGQVDEMRVFASPDPVGELPTFGDEMLFNSAFADRATIYVSYRTDEDGNLAVQRLTHVLKALNMANEENTAGQHIVVAHSMGGIVATDALNGLGDDFTASEFHVWDSPFFGISRRGIRTLARAAGQVGGIGMGMLIGGSPIVGGYYALRQIPRAPHNFWIKILLVVAIFLLVIMLLIGMGKFLNLPAIATAFGEFTESAADSVMDNPFLDLVGTQRKCNDRNTKLIELSSKTPVRLQYFVQDGTFFERPTPTSVRLIAHNIQHTVLPRDGQTPHAFLHVKMGPRIAQNALASS